MKHEIRHKRVWAALYRIASKYVKYKFNLKADVYSGTGPCIVIPNHVTDWDPLLVAMSFPKNNLYFVASEHIFRKGLISRVINWLFAPIPRRKASVGFDTAAMCLRRLREGGNVCLFGEGDASWDGLTKPVFSATGKMVKVSGATLVTYKIEGGYLSDPRWGKGLRKGHVYAHPVGVYSPEQLKDMSPQQINDIINHDIYEDAWQRQAENQVEYVGKNRAQYIETALFICPSCKRIGTIRGSGNRVKCACSLDLLYTTSGKFDPAVPFENIAQWDRWQFSQLKNINIPEKNSFFFDDNLTLSEIFPDHTQKRIFQGRISQFIDRLCCGTVTFLLDEIDQMAMVQNNVLLLMTEGRYFEIQSKNSCCLRKYLAVWENRRGSLKTVLKKSNR